MILGIDPGNLQSAYVVLDKNLKPVSIGKVDNEELLDMIYKVYKHTVPNGKVYIGITCLTVANRWRKGKGYKNSILFSRAIEKHGWNNITHEILFDNLTMKEAQDMEIKLISEFKSANKNHGYNIEYGGRTGSTGIKRSAKTLEKMRKANLGKQMAEETKQRISEKLKGREFTPEHRMKKSLAQIGDKNHRFGKKASEETRKRMVESQPKGINHKLSRKIAQISIDKKEVIKTWNSMGDIRRELGLKHCCISDCCRGIQKTSGGFIWEYYENLKAAVDEQV